MHLLTLLILGIVLLCKGNALKCYECTGMTGECPASEKACPLPGLNCGAMRITSYMGGSKLTDMSVKSCVMPEQCLQGSVNLGIAKTVVTSTCCSTDLCNQNPPEPKKTTPNGKKCYGCDATKCTQTINCEGEEDHCITVSVPTGNEATVMKGCASKQLCSDAAKQAGAVGGDFNCCQGNYCNSAGSVGASLLLLVVPLVSLVMFS